MFKRFRILKILIIAVVAFAPLIVDRQLATRYNYYQKLLETHECYPIANKNLWLLHRNQCVGDFDGDGKPGSVVLKANKDEDFRGKIAIVDSEQTLFYLDYVYQTEPDEMMYLAIRNESGRARLIVFDEVTKSTPTISVFAWDGKQIAETQPLNADMEILNALKAEGGDTAHLWSQYRFFRRPVLFLYYSILFVAAYCLHRRHVFVARHKTEVASESI